MICRPLCCRISATPEAIPFTKRTLEVNPNLKSPISSKATPIQTKGRLTEETLKKKITYSELLPVRVHSLNRFRMMASCYYSPYQSSPDQVSDNLWKSPATAEFGLGAVGRSEIDYSGTIHFPYSSYQQTYKDYCHYKDLQPDYPSGARLYPDGAVADTTRGIRATSSHHHYHPLTGGSSQSYTRSGSSASTSFSHYLNHRVWRPSEKQPTSHQNSESNQSFYPTTTYPCAEKTKKVRNRPPGLVDCSTSQKDNNFGRPIECKVTSPSNNSDYNPASYFPLREEHFSTNYKQHYYNESNNISNPCCDLQTKTNAANCHNGRLDDVFEKATVSPRNVKKENKRACRLGKNVCRLCGKSYARPSTLKTHMRVHSGEKPYKCSRCKKSFSQTANLTAHMRIHSGDRPYTCFICHRRFSQSSSVTTHMRIHSGERPYRCSFCRKAFADSSTLTKHLRVHSGEKPYRCNICHLRFSQSGNLTRHMRVHGQV